MTVKAPARRKPKTSIAKDGPSPVDVHVGSRIRLRRSLLGMSQEKLGEAIGLTFQQVQKYERGMNRVSASKLWKLSTVLDVPVSYFFDGLDGDAAPSADLDAPPAQLGDDDLSRRETINLVRAYYRLPSGLRGPMSALIKAAAAIPEDGGAK